jgi:glycosyltransferase involved in cell wall biosynthesis
VKHAYDVVVYAPWGSSLVGGRSFGGAAGGAETQGFLLATHLAERGLRVAVIVFGSGRELPATVAGIDILPQARRLRSHGLADRIEFALEALRSMIGAKGDVLIHLSAGSTTAVAALAARIRGGHFVYRSANVFDFAFETVEPRALNVRLYEWGVRRASAIVVQSADQADLCRERFGREPVVVKSIATPAERRTQRPEAFLWVGRLQDWKRPDAYLELARAVPEAQFWMIAVPQKTDDVEMRRGVEETVRGLPNVRLLEPRPRAELGELIARAVAVVTTGDREGMPNVFLEGWSRGVPALTLSFDPDGIIARNRLGWSADGDPRRFADETRRAWRERDDQGELAERCIAYVRAEHDKDASIQVWLDTIERIRRG